MYSSRLIIPAVVSVLFALSVPELRRTVLDTAGLAAPGPALAVAATPTAGPHPDAIPDPEPLPTRIEELVEISLAEIEAGVVRLSDPDALRHAFHAYHSFRDANPDRVTKPYLYFVDFGLESSVPRGYVFDMDALRIVEGPFAVAHGRGSARSGPVPTRFSNLRGSNATSLGLYLAQETYGFRGRSGGRSYTSVGLRLHGVSGRFN
jgi:hypothetical protein